MKIGKHHVQFSTALILVVVQLSLAGAFLADAAQTNGSYDALAGHRVAVSGQLLGCAYTSRRSAGHVCRFNYNYQGVSFSFLLSYGEQSTAYVDPANPSIRMPEVNFDSGPTTIVGDLVIASCLIAGAILTAALHAVHRRRRTQMARRRVKMPGYRR
jgi:uncharacterized membrane protein YidH (DUF202 family)